MLHAPTIPSSIRNLSILGFCYLQWSGNTSPRDAEGQSRTGRSRTWEFCKSGTQEWREIWVSEEALIMCGGCREPDFKLGDHRIRNWGMVANRSSRDGLGPKSGWPACSPFIIMSHGLELLKWWGQSRLSYIQSICQHCHPAYPKWELWAVGLLQPVLNPSQYPIKFLTESRCSGFIC